MRRIILFLVTTVIVALAAPVAQANVCSKAYNVRQAVVKKQGKRAPGRNICRLGVKYSNGHVRPATYEQKKRYLFQLRALNAPPVTRYVRVAAIPPRQRPAGTLTPATRYSSGGGYAIPRSIVMCESGGDYNARNPSGAYGAYQIMPGTAQAHNCDLSTPGGQDVCAARIWASQGRGAWSC